jgi:hypothetical protein
MGESRFTKAEECCHFEGSYMIRRVYERIRAAAIVAWEWFDLRDLLVFGGLMMAGYGLWLYRPWIAFSVCGVALVAIGLFFGRGKS